MERLIVKILVVGAGFMYICSYNMCHFTIQIECDVSYYQLAHISKRDEWNILNKSDDYYNIDTFHSNIDIESFQSTTLFLTVNQ